MYLKPRNISALQHEASVKPRYKKSIAVKELEQMVLDADRAKHPLIPPQYVAPTSFRDDSANGLIRCILTFLKLSGHPAKQISSTIKRSDNRTTFEDVNGRKRTIGSISYMRRSDKSGAWDISAIIFNSSVKIKIGPYQQNLIYADYPKVLEIFGEKFLIVSSFEQFMDWYNSNFREDLT